LEQFGFDQERWAEAVTDWAARKAEVAAVARIEQTAREKVETERRTQLESNFRNAESKYADSIEDYADTVYSNRATVTPHMAEAIMASPLGPQLAYQIVKSGKDREIANLPPALQGRAIALIEAQLSNRPAPTVTRAAPPPTPVSTAVAPSSNPLRDDLTDQDWMALRRQQLADRRQR
jgi:hypothetical protein